LIIITKLNKITIENKFRYTFSKHYYKII